ncbi:hypothetical protein V8E52_008407 [Russula decolorans]
MQHAVEHDEQGLSNYAMCAANPSRVGKTFDDAALHEIDLKSWRREKHPRTHRTSPFLLLLLPKHRVYQRSIPLAGLDVPFHSRYLWSGVMPFWGSRLTIPLPDVGYVQPEDDQRRKFLAIAPAPSPAFASASTSMSTPSPVPTFPAPSAPASTPASGRLQQCPGKTPSLAWVLPVELLPYQFAPLVCWIEMQDLFFEQYKFKCFIGARFSGRHPPSSQHRGSKSGLRYHHAVDWWPLSTTPTRGSEHFKALLLFNTIYGIGPATARTLNIRIALELRCDLMRTIPPEEVEAIHTTIMNHLNAVEPGCVSTTAGRYHRAKPESNYLADVFSKPDGWIETPEADPDADAKPGTQLVYMIDCEMCLTEDGKALTRVASLTL